MLLPERSRTSRLTRSPKMFSESCVNWFSLKSKRFSLLSPWFGEKHKNIQIVGYMQIVWHNISIIVCASVSLVYLESLFTSVSAVYLEAVSMSHLCTWNMCFSCTFLNSRHQRSLVQRTMIDMCVYSNLLYLRLSARHIRLQKPSAVHTLLSRGTIALQFTSNLSALQIEVSLPVVFLDYELLPLSPELQIPIYLEYATR